MFRKIVAAGFACLVMVGCASTGGLKDKSSIDPAGIVTIVAPGEISWFGDDPQKGGGLLGKIAGEIAKDNEEMSTLLSRTDKLVDDFSDMLSAKLKAVETFKIVEKDVIVQSDFYQGISDNEAQKASDIIAADGYKLVAYSDKKVTSKIGPEVGIKGQMYITANFQKMMMSGVAKNGKVGAQIMLTCVILDENGKAAFNKTYQVKSEGTTPVVAGIYDPEKLMALFPDIMDDVCDSLVDDLL